MRQFIAKPPPMTFMAKVVAVTQVTPGVRRLTIGGDDLATIMATGALATPGAWVTLFPCHGHGRDYSIRQQNVVAGTIDVDIVLYPPQLAAGKTVSAWATQVVVGAEVRLLLPAEAPTFSLNRFARWLWLAADETALPALQSILADLPLGLDVHVLVLASGITERQALSTKAELNEVWLYRDSSTYVKELTKVVTHADALEGYGQVWLAGAAQWVKNWQVYWLREHGQRPEDLYAQGYWQQGQAGFKDQQRMVS